MEKKVKKNKAKENSIEASIMKFVERALRKTIKRNYYSDGISLAFMKDEFIDKLGQMSQNDIMNFLNTPSVKDIVLDKVGEVLSNLTLQERNRRIQKVRQRILRAERTRRWNIQRKKRQEKWKTDNAKKIKAHKDLQKAIDDKLPKRYANMLKKLAPGLKNDIKPNYNPYNY